MRKIKFKWWDSDDLEMCHELHAHREGQAINEMLEDIQDVGLICMEYTGLKDKNGTEICEGDILHINWVEAYKRKNSNFVVRIEPGIVYAKCVCGCTDFVLARLDENEDEFVEIIGNIYENPELLEEKE